MKYLKIEENKGYFRNAESEWCLLDTISKDLLMTLLDKAISNEFEMDEFNVEILGNKAHQIIYKNLYEKFKDLFENKGRIKDESEQLYRTSIDRYKKKIDNGDQG